MVRLYMAAKNHHIILVGPTDSQGVVEFPWVRVEHQVDRVRRFFIMDYAGLDQWTGRASVMFMDISEVERYLKAAETWRSSSLLSNGAWQVCWRERRWVRARCRAGSVG
ncbi:MAG: hypothetical protein U5R48_09910 [Gammaproteobacteria bacterium]|nr:hypothetical protein [Gammaproteobacteria bacterium]